MGREVVSNSDNITHNSPNYTNEFVNDILIHNSGNNKTITATKKIQPYKIISRSFFTSPTRCTPHFCEECSCSPSDASLLVSHEIGGDVIVLNNKTNFFTKEGDKILN
jgi:hypothetical protein